MQAPKFIVKGIVSPGKINVLVAGRFRDVELYNASQEVLAELYANQSPYVALSPEEESKTYKGKKKIEVRQIGSDNE